MRRLSIWWGEALVGMLLDTEPLSLAYDPTWRAASGAQPLAPLLPLAEPEHRGEAERRRGTSSSPTSRATRRCGSRP